MIIIGLGGILSDAACALLRDGELVAAIEEKKIAGALYAGRTASAGHCRPVLQIAEARRASRLCRRRPAIPGRILLYICSCALSSRMRGLSVVEHHTAHAASAWYASHFADATVLTLDHAGDLRCGARWHGDGAGLQIDKEMYYPDSFGDLYGRVTELLGFQSNADEHKVQWLSTAAMTGSLRSSIR